MAIRRVSSLEELDLPNKYIYQGNNGYIYNFKDVLNIEPQTIKEEYNPTTGEKIVI